MTMDRNNPKSSNTDHLTLLYELFQFDCILLVIYISTVYYLSMALAV